ncbi:hypothetical protein [Pontibacter actiniarum]|uniref:Uncharacterized protein n=1 Tax=Pontibacter actiniarum TaxID=323450 RepID=A0A1X9YWG0_9BACT|nr:hypothetical protein [Pontibacter actiniarum]ARS37208.1 hypothetical protein CA264_18215 [Pontibacter actiniarum]
MRKINLLLWALCLALGYRACYAQEPVPPFSDDRLKVMAVVHLLSENKCSHSDFPFLPADAPLGKYRTHLAVKYWKALRNRYKLYPYEVSVNLTVQDGLFRVQRQTDNAFFTALSEQERTEFVRLLNDFSYRHGLAELRSYATRP